MFTIEVATTQEKKFVEFYEAGKVSCAVDSLHVAQRFIQNA